MPLADQRLQALGDHPDGVGLETGEVHARKKRRAGRSADQRLGAELDEMGHVRRLRDHRVDLFHRGGQPFDVRLGFQLRPAHRGDVGGRVQGAQTARHGVGLAVAEHHQAQARGRRAARRRPRRPQLQQGQALGRVHVVRIELDDAAPGGLGLPHIAGRFGGVGQPRPGPELVRHAANDMLQVGRRSGEAASPFVQIGQPQMRLGVIRLGGQNSGPGRRFAGRVAQHAAHPRQALGQLGPLGLGVAEDPVVDLGGSDVPTLGQRGGRTHPQPPA